MDKDTKYEYFVSYHFINFTNTKSGFGNISIIRKKPVEQMSDIKDIEDYISVMLGDMYSVVVLNYQQLLGQRR